MENSLKFVDAVQVGSKSMQNFSLLNRIGKLNIPVILLIGYFARIKEWICAAKYILCEDNENIILCERGIRTISEKTRNTLDITAPLVIKEITALPIIMDPSHATDISKYVLPVALVSVVVGADGLMIEVHNNPKSALSDGRQSIDVEEFVKLIKAICETLILRSQVL